MNQPAGLPLVGVDDWYEALRQVSAKSSADRVNSLGEALPVWDELRRLVQDPPFTAGFKQGKMPDLLARANDSECGQRPGDGRLSTCVPRHRAHSG